jgi:hypothetical protein
MIIAPRLHQTFLRAIESVWPLAKGSLARVRKPCIRPDCQTCKTGVKHEAFIFVFSKSGKRRCRYVPQELVPVLRNAIENGRNLQKLISELGEELIKDYRRKRQ